MEEIDKIPRDKEICKLTEGLTPLKFGYTTAIYKIGDDKIVKVIYLKTKNNKIQHNIEYFIAEKLKTIRELKKYIVPYYGGSLCPPNEGENNYSLKLIYDYVPYKTIYEQYKNLKVEDYEFIFQELNKILNILNSNGIWHDDLHWGNIFYDLDTKRVILTDWEKGKFDNTPEDLNRWKGVIKNQLVINSLFDFGDFKTLKKIMLKIKNNKNESLFKQYIYLYEKYRKKFEKQRLTNPDLNIEEALERQAKDIVGGLYINNPEFTKEINRIVKINKDIKKFFRIN